MQNQEIIAKLKKQLPALQKIQGSEDADKLKNLIDETKIYIFGLLLDKKDENLRKGVIKMIEEYRTSSRCRLYGEVIERRNRLQNIIKSYVEVLEIREKALETEEKSD